MHGHAERLQHRPVGVAERLGQRVQPRGRPGQVALQAAVAGGVAGEDERPAQVGVALQAQVAVVARDRRVDRDADAVERAALDHAGHLVPPTIGWVIRASPMPPSSYQCRSDPQSPTAVIRTRLSPSAGPASAPRRGERRGRRGTAR